MIRHVLYITCHYIDPSWIQYMFSVLDSIPTSLSRTDPRSQPPPSSTAKSQFSCESSGLKTFLHFWIRCSRLVPCVPCLAISRSRRLRFFSLCFSFSFTQIRGWRKADRGRTSSFVAISFACFRRIIVSSPWIE